jgi:hypothetical protein
MMKGIVVATTLSLAFAGLVLGAAGSEARSYKKQPRQSDRHAKTYPYATQRQLRNAEAYDRGDYFEQDSNAHPVGSRGWWELKERESGDRLRF